MKKIVYLSKSKKKGKKWTVYITPPGKTIHFGASGMSDYTIHKDRKRMMRYNTRHRKRESWGCSGILSAGFWSKNLLWNKPSFSQSKRDIARRCNVVFRSGGAPRKSVRKSRGKKSVRKSRKKSREKRSIRKSRKNRGKRSIRKSRKRSSRKRSSRKRSVRKSRKRSRGRK